MASNVNNRYTRVSPRDLFNEAKLLKCLGQLALHIIDAKAGENLTYRDSGLSYKVGMHNAGYLVLTQGIRFYLRGKRIWLAAVVNSRKHYPLLTYCKVMEEEISVFNEDGTLSEEFNIFIGNVEEEN